MLVRRATLVDAPLIAELNAVVQTLHHERLPERFKPADATTFLPTVQDWLVDDVRVAFLAIADDAGAIGYVFAVNRQHPGNPLTHPRTTVELDQIAVHPRNRRQGVGAALVHQVFDHARTLGADAVELGVYAFNGDAQSFFAAMGFRTVLLRMALPVDPQLR